MAISSLPLGSIDISTRPNRRKAVDRIIGVLGIIYAEEEAYMERIPLNLKDSHVYACANDSLHHLISAILTLSDAY